MLCHKLLHTHHPGSVIVSILLYLIFFFESKPPMLSFHPYILQMPSFKKYEEVFLNIVNYFLIVYVDLK